MVSKFFNFVLAITALAAAGLSHEASSPAWVYICRGGKCVKTPFDDVEGGQSLSVCRMLCGNDIGTLWPKPTTAVKRGDSVIKIDQNKIIFEHTPSPKLDSLWEKVKSRFREKIDRKTGDLSLEGGVPLFVRIHLEELGDEMPKLSYDTNENYLLKITKGRTEIFADIAAQTFFGARHGLETLLQLIVYDDVEGALQILAHTEISDAPVYKHRGVMLDTGRHYFSVDSIKRTLDAMAMSKLNTFHWHLVDSNSFPLVVQSHPDLHRLGAYSARQVYTRQDIREVVAYALVRGIRVIPAFDGPAHTGEGWQNKNLTVCFNTHPWKKFCNQPPCGQLDPTIDALYDVLEDIYREIFESVHPNMFHMGGDTVSFSCWNSSNTIRQWMKDKGLGADNHGFIELWGHFQTNALARVDKVSADKEVPIILWAGDSAWAPFFDEYLDESRYIIQTVWNKAQSNTRQILDRGFKVIASGFDLFIKGGTTDWTGEERSEGWQKFYKYRPDIVFGRQNDQVLGAEALVWSEQIDEFTLDGLLWPKASALAERLWSNPEDSWHKAVARLLIHRELLAESSIRAEAVQPEWCVRNQDQCFKNDFV